MFEGQLFDDGRYYLPEWRGGETLYSWCAHFHYLASNGDSRVTSQQLFGDFRAGLKFDFPVGLDRLIARTGGALGSRTQILFDRTPFRAFVRFVEPARLAAVSDLIGTGQAYQVARKLGLTRLGVPAPLKACPECMAESLRSEYSTSWQIDHQLPGVYVCKQHAATLQIANPDGHHRARREFVLPHHLNSYEWHPHVAVSLKVETRLERLSEWSRALIVSAESPAVPFDMATLRDACHLRASELNLVGIDGSLNFKTIRQELYKEYADLVNIPGLEFLDDVQKESGGFAGLLLRQYHNTHHPLMHCALLSFLFESPTKLFLAYNQIAKLDPPKRRESLRRKRAELCRNLVDLVTRQQKSVSQAARSLGIDPARAIVLLAETNVPYETRPRIVGTEIERKLIEHLETGEEPTLISSTLNIRRAYIADYLASRPDLRNRHLEKRAATRRDAYREKFLRTLALNPSLPIRRIRRETDSGFEWLYRNDRDWLAEQLPGIWHRE